MSSKKGFKALETYVPALEGGQVLSHSKTVLSLESHTGIHSWESCSITNHSSLLHP